MADRKKGGLTPRGQLVLLVVVAVVIAGAGVWTWAAARTGDSPDVQPTSAPSQSIEPVGPGGDSGEGSSPAGAPSSPSSSAPKVSQSASAKKALSQVVPKWASLKMPAGGPDSTAWMKTWREEPAAGGGFVSQSRNNFGGLFKGLAALNASGKVDKVESAESLWQEGNLSGWKVTVKRNLRSADDFGGVNETETLMWEFVVEQRPDGSSQLTSYAAAPAGDG